MASRWLVVLLATAVAGCASFKGAPDQSISEDNADRNIAETTINTVLDAAVEKIERGETPTNEAERNEIVYASMAEIDALYAEFEVAIVGEVRRSDFFTTLAELAVDGAGSFAGGGTSRILSAVSAGITGATESFDKDILVDRTAQALTTQMRASRKLARARMLPRLQQSLATYPFTAAVSDLIAYRQAGTIVSALQEIAADATKAEQEGSNELEKAEAAAFVHEFGADANSRLIRGRLTQDDGTRDQAFAAEIRNWLKYNRVVQERPGVVGPDGRPIKVPPTITTFIEASTFARERQRFVDYLNEQPGGGG